MKALAKKLKWGVYALDFNNLKVIDRQKIHLEMNLCGNQFSAARLRGIKAAKSRRLVA